MATEKTTLLICMMPEDNIFCDTMFSPPNSCPVIPDFNLFTSREVIFAYKYVKCIVTVNILYK